MKNLPSSRPGPRRPVSWSSGSQISCEPHPELLWRRPRAHQVSVRHGLGRLLPVVASVRRASAHESTAVRRTELMTDDITRWCHLSPGLAGRDASDLETAHRPPSLRIGGADVVVSAYFFSAPGECRNFTDGRYVDTVGGSLLVQACCLI